MYFLWYLLIGLIVGYIASLIVKGSGSGLLLNIVLLWIASLLSHKKQRQQ